MKTALMRNYTIIFFLLFCVNVTHAQFFPVDTAALNTAYRDLVNDPNTLERQQAFFNAFPNTWMEFIMTYQYVPMKEYDLAMYNSANEHIEALTDLVTLIPDSVYCKKIINLATGARWDADAASYLQNLLQIKMEQYMDTLFKIIGKLPTGHQMEFWQFYWSNIVRSKPIEVEYARLRKLNFDIYPAEIEIMDIAYKYFYNGINIPENYLSDSYHR